MDTRAANCFFTPISPLFPKTKKTGFYPSARGGFSREGSSVSPSEAGGGAARFFRFRRPRNITSRATAIKTKTYAAAIPATSKISAAVKTLPSLFFSIFYLYFIHIVELCQQYITKYLDICFIIVWFLSGYCVFLPASLLL